MADVLDPQVRAFIDEVAAAGVPPIESLSPSAVRALQRNLVPRLAGPLENVSRVVDRAIPGRGGPLPVRFYLPEGTGPFGVLVWVHGGGWTIGSIETADAACRALARRTPCIVASVGYRLAPEHRFPAAFEDVVAATKWIARNAADFGGDPGRLAIGGDSSGGTLAIAATLAAREDGPALRFQVLVYPVVDCDFGRPSYRQYANGFLITLGEMRWYWDNYLASASDLTSPYVCPLRAAALDGLPATLMLQASCDPLLDEGRAYAARLRDCGVSVQVIDYEGMVHGFFTMPGAVERARTAYADAAAALRFALA